MFYSSIQSLVRDVKLLLQTWANTDSDCISQQQEKMLKNDICSQPAFVNIKYFCLDKKWPCRPFKRHRENKTLSNFINYSILFFFILLYILCLVYIWGTSGLGNTRPSEMRELDLELELEHGSEGRRKGEKWAERPSPRWHWLLIFITAVNSGQ